MMARINESEFGETPFQRLLGHNIDILNGWNQLGEVLRKRYESIISTKGTS